MPLHFLIPQIFARPGKGKRVDELLEPMIKYSHSEVNNYAYFFFHKEDDADTIWGIESYAAKSDLYDTHMGSSEFKTFAGTLEKEEVPAKGLGLNDLEPAFGFLTRENQTSPSGKFVWIAEVTLKSSKDRETALEAARPLAKYVEEHEPKTNSYLFLKDLKNDSKMWVFEVYDNKEALTEIHHKSDAFKTFFTTLKDGDLVADKASTGFRATGQGYLQKDAGKHIFFR